MIVWLYVALTVGAMALSMLAVPMTRRLAVRTGMIDVPSGHKAHARPTPLLGGLAILLGVLLPSLLGLMMALRFGKRWRRADAALKEANATLAHPEAFCKGTAFTVALS